MNKPADRNLVTNRRASFDYFLEDHWEAGIQLTGSEVKSLRAGKANLQDAWVRVHDGQAWLIGTHISPYEQANRFNHEPLRERRLLLNRSELNKIERQVREKSRTVVPTRIYLKGSFVKVEIATATGKKNYDKRASLREKAVQDDLRRR